MAKTVTTQPFVLFVLPGLGAGGSEHVVTFLANRFSRQGYRVLIASCESDDSRPYYPTDSAVEIAYLDVPVGSHGGLRTLQDIIRRIRRLRALLLATRPNLVISFLTRTNVISVLAARGLRIPVIVSERNNPQRQKPGPFWRVMRRFTYARAYGLITMTCGALHYFPPVMRPRGWVIPNMADWQHFRPRFDNEVLTLTAVGRFTEQKGFDLLLQAFAMVAHQHPEWRLRIWGEGPDRAELEALATRLGIADRVEMPSVSKEPGGWIESADAFVLSSRFEGWGLVLGEAMAAGLPSVSFDCPFGPADMITHGVDGLLVPNENVPALAHALSNLMADEALRQHLGTSATAAAERFAPEAIGKKWQAVICRVLEETGGKLAIEGIE